MSTQLGSLPKDQNGTSVQVPTGFITKDGASSPVASPLTLTGSIQTITKPDNAVEIIVTSEAHSISVSESSTLATSYTLSAGTSEVFELGRMDFIYIQGTNGDVVNFRFNLV